MAITKIEMENLTFIKFGEKGKWHKKYAFGLFAGEVEMTIHLVLVSRNRSDKKAGVGVLIKRQKRRGVIAS